MKHGALSGIILLLFIFALLSGCGSAPAAGETAQAPTETAAQPAAEAPVPAEESAAEPPEETAEAAEEDQNAAEPRVMVVVFSGTGHTRRIAQVMAEGLGTELREIVPAEPYTEEDLNYNDSATRATKEQNDPAARPGIAEPVEGLEDCDILFLGYPIWWGQEPRILDTFVETYDLTGITVVPFCTSGSSGIGTSVRQLSELADGADWAEGRRFETDAPAEEINEWAAQMLAAAAG